MRKVNTLWWLHGSLVLFVSLFIAPVTATADATMSLSPLVGTYRVYDDVIVQVLMSSEGDPVRSVDARLVYDPEVLTVTHVLKEGSIITSWVQEPYVDAELGEISFGGWMASSSPLNRSLVLSLRVRPERVGDARIRFESGSAIIAADDAGSNILTGFQSARYRIEPEDLGEVVAEVSPEGAPSSSGEVLGEAVRSGALSLSSPTHPDPDAWYKHADATLHISFPDEASVLFLGLDAKPDGSAVVRYAPPITEKTLEQLKEGVWYAHARIVGGEGGATAHLRLQVDRTPPSDLLLSEVPRPENADPNIVFSVGALDELSGVSHYAFSVNGGNAEDWRDDGSHTYRFRATAQGEHVLKATAYDKAGNSTSTEARFSVGYLAEPVVASRSNELREGDRLMLEVTSNPEALVEVTIVHDGDPAITEQVRVEGDGTSLHASDVLLQPGTYRIWAIAHDERGAVSRVSNEVTLVVSPTIWGTLSRHPGTLFALLTALLIVLFVRRVLRSLHEQVAQESTQLYGGEHAKGTDHEVVAPKSLATPSLSSAQVVLEKR